MYPTKGEFEQIKQELIVLQKRLELLEEKARLNEMKNKQTGTIDWLYQKYKEEKETKPICTTKSGDTIYFDNMNRSSNYEFN